MSIDAHYPPAASVEYYATHDEQSGLQASTSSKRTSSKYRPSPKEQQRLVFGELLKAYVYAFRET